MRKHSFLFLTAMLSLLMSVIIYGCSDNPGLHTGSNDGETGFSIIIPRPVAISENGTRAADSPTQAIAAEESTIKSMWLYIFKDGYLFKKEDVTAKMNEGKISDISEQLIYETKTDAGKYRVYVVANLDSYLDGVTMPETEDDLRELVLTFSKEVFPSTDKGLPMACLAEEVTLTDGTVADNGDIEIKDGETVEVHADLLFLCAKLRYTFLFDNSKDGFSRLVFGNNMIDFSNVSVNNLVNKTNLIGGNPSTISPFDIESGPLSKARYPEDISAWLENRNVSGDNAMEIPDNLQGKESWTETESKRAWQGTVYIPENLDKEKPSLLTLKATCNDRELTYSVILPNPGAEGNELAGQSNGILKRGHFYDLVARVYSLDRFDIITRVEDWSLQKVTYNLHGPYFLHVEETSIPVQAGVESRLWYESDTDISIVSPKYPYDGKDIDFYDYSLRNDSIIISVNPEVPYSEIKDLSDKSKYNFFHIKAGNLLKRIEVTPLELSPFLNVSPVNISIDVRELIASGKYNGQFSITASTNLPKIKIEKIAGWDAVTGSLLKLSDNNDTDSNDITTGTVCGIEGSSKFNLIFSGLNSGNEFWKELRQLSLRFTAIDENGNEILVNGNKLTEDVSINIIPAVHDYIIHFHATGWKNPHIYVYQCLEFPATYVDASGNTVKHPYANKPVGVNEKGENAALEYSFTGKIAFKGWGIDGNTDYANPGGPVNGFYYLPTTNGSWNPNESGFTRHYYDDMDFCESHRRDKITKNTKPCYSCNSSYNKLWPGIQMEDEGNGWWKFILSGVATPGKALIMFNDGHYSNTTQCRYPGDNEVGIPLFDYPSREGWFDLDTDLEFHATKPQTTFSSSMYVLKWEKADINVGDFWKVYIEDADTHIPYRKMSSSGKSYHSVDNDIFSFTFYTSIQWNPSRINVILLDGNNMDSHSQIFTLYISDFGGDPKNYVIKKSDIKKHDPNYNTYRIYWPKSKGQKIHMWITGGEVITPNDANGKTYMDYYYHDFYIKKGNEDSNINILFREIIKEFYNFASLGDFKYSKDNNGYELYTLDFTDVEIFNQKNLSKTNNIRIRWNKDIKDKDNNYATSIHVWDRIAVKNYTTWPGPNDIKQDGSYRYFDFEIGNGESIGYLLTNGINKNLHGDQLLYCNKLVYDEALNKYVYTIESL